MLNYLKFPGRLLPDTFVIHFPALICLSRDFSFDNNNNSHIFDFYTDILFKGKIWLRSLKFEFEEKFIINPVVYFGLFKSLHDFFSRQSERDGKYYGKCHTNIALYRKSSSPQTFGLSQYLLYWNFTDLMDHLGLKRALCS